jgi:hypothetical protein
MATLILENNNIKEAPVGFSWTSLFFGPLVPLIRSDFMIFLMCFILSIISSGISSIIQAFVYNKAYARSLIQAGYKVREYPDSMTEEALKSYLGVVHIPYADIA